MYISKSNTDVHFIYWGRCHRNHEVLANYVQVGNKHTLIEAKNGKEALKYLESGKSLPNIILLDLNMPRMNGIEFLGILKQHDKIKYLPSIVLTTSENRDDLLECYKIGMDTLLSP